MLQNAPAKLVFIKRWELLPSNSIPYQFLTEAIVICQFGGIAGIFLGILIGNLVTPALGGSFLIPWGWMGLGFGLCMLVGVLLVFIRH